MRNNHIQDNDNDLFLGRKKKAKLIWLKYGGILRGRILDVGSDECYLREHLTDATYFGIGQGGNPDVRVNLENARIPFPNNCFDCVLCLDVLEHLDNIHVVFDEICRVSRRYVLISLPNPWGAFYRMLRKGDRTPYDPLFQYGLPPEPPEDRHKWFFSNEEAEKFIFYRAAKNRMRIKEIHTAGIKPTPLKLRTIARLIAERLLFQRNLNHRNITSGNLWAILEKETITTEKLAR